MFFFSVAATQRLQNAVSSMQDEYGDEFLSVSQARERLVRRSKRTLVREGAVVANSIVVLW